MRSVVITGAAGGIGCATASLLVSKGWHVFAGVRREADADRLSSRLGPALTPLVFDVTDEAAVAAAASRVSAALGDERLGGLVNNAGVAITGPLLQIDAGELRQQLEVNLVAPLVMARAFAPLLGTERSRRGEPGPIVNISSSAGFITVPFLGPYAASKHGLEALGDALRRELWLYGIRVVTVGPGFVETPFVDKTLSGAHVPPPGSAFEHAYRRYEQEAARMRRTAVTPERVASVIATALSASRPKERYAIVGSRLRNWILPRLVSKRLFDVYVAHTLGLKP